MHREHKFGLKIVSSDWFWKYDIGYDAAVAKLQRMGVDFVMVNSDYFPVGDTAVPSSEAPPAQRHKMAQYDEKVFRAKLREAGIAYFGWAIFGFNEPEIHRHGAHAVDQNGVPIEKVDWYIGACPTCESYVRECVRLAGEGARELEVDGLLLGFMRYPGFWELWLPGTDANAWREYCYCERCLGKFATETGIEVTPEPGQTPGQWLRANRREEWTAFKGKVIRDIVAAYRDALHESNPAGKIMLNTVAFEPGRFGGAAREVFGQDIAQLRDVVDIFELMGYHQIVGQPTQWLADTSDYFKRETGCEVVCTVQGQALYTEGMHAGRGRSEVITIEEFERALAAVRGSAADGTVVFTWSDFLRKELEEGDPSLTEAVTRAFGTP